MSYPELLYKGQYTLKRVLTMPVDPNLSKAEIGTFVSIDPTGGHVVAAAADAKQFMVLRTVNSNDNICTVDYSGVHTFKASGAISAGDAICPAGADTVKTGAGDETTKCIALTPAASGEDVHVFFLI
jgi:hypothetical protein